MNKDWSALPAKLEKYKYPLLILLIGLALLLIPTSEKRSDPAPGAQEELAALLSQVKGVGEARVLSSESGGIVACTGAADAKVRLDMIRAAAAYTGFGSDRIIILKLRT